MLLMFLYRTLEAKTVRDEKKEKTQWKKRTEKPCRFFNHLRMNVIERIVRAKFNNLKHQMTKHQMRGLFPVMFPGVNIPRFKQKQNKIVPKNIKSLVRHCFCQSKPMKLKAK